MSTQQTTATTPRSATATPTPPGQDQPAQEQLLPVVAEDQHVVASPPPAHGQRRSRRQRSTSTSARATTPGPASRPQSRRAGATEAEVFGWQEERGQLQGENAALREELAGLRTTLRKAQEDAEHWSERAHDLEDEYRKVERQRDEAMRKVAARTVHITADGEGDLDARLAGKCAALKRERDEAVQGLETVTSRLRAEEAESDRLAARCKTAETRLDTARTRARTAEESARRLQQELNTAKAELETTTAERDHAVSRVTELEDEVAELQGQVASSEASMARMGRLSPIHSSPTRNPRRPTAATAADQGTSTTSSDHSTTDVEVAALKAKVESLERKLAEEKHGRRLAEQERAAFAIRCDKEHVDAKRVLVKTVSASNPQRAEAWQQQLVNAFRWIRTEFGNEDAERLVAEAETEVFLVGTVAADASGDDAPSQQPETRGRAEGASTRLRLFGQGPAPTTTEQPAAPPRRGGRTPPQAQAQQPAELPAPVGRAPPVTLSEQERHHLETLARAADEIAQAQQAQAQPPAQTTVQPVFLQNLTIPQFNPKNARRWIDIVEDTFAQFDDAQATNALQRAMGTEYVNVADVYGHVPKTKTEWIAAIRAVYPGDDPKVVANRVRNMTKNENETLEHFIRRGIQEARGTAWKEQQIVDELIDICWRPDTNYLNRHPRPETTMKLLEKARSRDKEQQEGRDPSKSASGKGKQPAPARPGDVTTGPKKATTAATYAETAAASETQGAHAKTPAAKGNAGTKPQGSAESDVVTKKELAAQLSRFEEMIKRLAAGQPLPQQQQQQAPRQAPFRTRLNPAIQGGCCFKCGEPGHGYRACPQNPPPPCPVCKETGHQPQQCPVVHGNTAARRPQRPAPTNTVGCQLCKEVGHAANNCPVLAAMAAGNQTGQGN